jgi:hypothetical protein
MPDLKHRKWELGQMHSVQHIFSFSMYSGFSKEEMKYSEH